MAGPRPLVPFIFPVVDLVRGIGGVLGFRPFSVTVRRRTWTWTTGSPPAGTQRPLSPGVPGSVKTDVDVVLQSRWVDGSYQPVMVRQLKRGEIFASGGAYSSRDLRVGPITPPFAASLLAPGVPDNGGGYDDSTINPAPASVLEIIWLLKSVPDGSHGILAGGVVCELKGQESTSMHYYAILRSTGRSPT